MFPITIPDWPRIVISELEISHWGLPSSRAIRPECNCQPLKPGIPRVAKQEIAYVSIVLQGI